MAVLDDALHKLGELANELYDDAKVDNRVAEAARAAHDAVDSLRERVTSFLDQFEDTPPEDAKTAPKTESNKAKGGQS
jgi:hypothetical protein